jgi:pimeloyl-ACP methyl ester carboxylesterase
VERTRHRAAKRRDVRTCRYRLASAGADLTAYNTTESASDIAELRIAMGIERWNIYGVSYGSDLALQVLRDHPEGVRSLVIDAVVPPNINVIETGSRAASESATAIYEACAAQPACHAAFPDGRAEYTRVINDLAAKPRTVHVNNPKTHQDATVVIDAYKLSYTVAFGTLIGSAPKIPSMIHDPAAGAGTEAALEVLAGVFPLRSTATGCNSALCAASGWAALNSDASALRASVTFQIFPPP